MLPHETLQAWWFQTAAGIVTQTTSEREIVALETRYRISLPDDFRAYLQWAVPNTTNWDDADGNWWPIERISNIPDECEHEVAEPIATNASKHLFFVDWNIWGWAWAISCGEDETRGKVALINGQTDRYVADSFSEFVDRYVTDWHALC